MLYFPNRGKSFIEEKQKKKNTNSTECAINQDNHGDNLAVWGGVSNNSLRPLKYHLNHQSNDFLNQQSVQGSPRDRQD